MKLKNVIKIGIVPFCAVTLLGCKRGDNKVQVTFKNYDGTILQTEEIERGSNTSFHPNINDPMPSKPLKENEEANVFMGWDKPLTNITKNTEFKAVYKTIKKGKYIDKDHDGMPEGVDPNDNPNDKSCNYFFVNAKSMVNLDQEIVIDFSKFLKDSANTQYDNNIAKLGLFLSNPKIDFNDGLFSDKAYGGRVNALYARLGCDEWHHFDFRKNNYHYDKNDTTSGVYAHKYLYDDEGNIKKDLIILAFEGTHGNTRWASNFDIGYAGEDYYSKAGDLTKHPEWDEYGQNFHKGFYVAAKRVLAETVDGDYKQEGPVKFLDFIDKHSSHSDGKPIVFVTGHSRGGAMANIVGEYLENHYKNEKGEARCIPFTYAFAAPAVWCGTKSERPSTSKIFNIINEDDLVTKVPFSGWGFTNFGDSTISKSVYKEYKTEYEKNKEGRAYDYIKNADSIFANLGCKDRETIYNLNAKYKESEDNYLSNELVTFDSLIEAQNNLEKVKSEYAELLGDYSHFYELRAVECTPLFGETYGAIIAKTCIGSVTDAVERLATGDEKLLNNIPTLLSILLNPAYTEMILELLPNFLVGGLDTVALPHDYGAYHVILRNYQEQK